LCSIILVCTLLHSILLYSTFLYHTLPYSTLPYLLHYTFFFSTLLNYYPLYCDAMREEKGGLCLVPVDAQVS
jgi:hypothetical protein